VEGNSHASHLCCQKDRGTTVLRGVCVWCIQKRDRNALHVRFADDGAFVSVCAGAAKAFAYPAGEQRGGKSPTVDAIHPGYGFLSKKATSESLRGIGNHLHRAEADNIEMMGDRKGPRAARSEDRRSAQIPWAKVRS